MSHHDNMSSQQTHKTCVAYNICIMLDQRRRRLANVVQMSYKYFVFAGMSTYPLNMFKGKLCMEIFNYHDYKHL